MHKPILKKEKNSKYNGATTAYSNQRHFMDVDSEHVTVERSKWKEIFE